MFAVVSVEKPTGQANILTGPWPAFRDESTRISPLPAGTTRIAENCWLIALPSGSGLLATVVHSAMHWQLKHQVLYFEKAPQVFESS